MTADPRDPATWPSKALDQRVCPACLTEAKRADRECGACGYGVEDVKYLPSVRDMLKLEHEVVWNDVDLAGWTRRVVKVIREAAPANLRAEGEK